MNFFLLKTTAVILAFTFWTNILVSGCPTVNRVEQPATPVSNNNPDAQSAVPSGWRKIEVDGKLSFYLPPDMRDTGIHGLENLHREYTNGRMHLSFDYQPFGYLAYQNRARAFGKVFQEIESQMDGRKTFLFLYQDSDRKNRRTYNADFYVGDLPNSDVLLHMWMSSRSARYIATAKNIFQTIKFYRHDCGMRRLTLA